MDNLAFVLGYFMIASFSYFLGILFIKQWYHTQYGRNGRSLGVEDYLMTGVLCLAWPSTLVCLIIGKIAKKVVDKIVKV